MCCVGTQGAGGTVVCSFDLHMHLGMLLASCGIVVGNADGPCRIDTCRQYF